MQLELELDGALDAELLAASLQAVVERHQSLRSGFWHEGLSRPVQVVAKRAAAPWRLIDLGGLAAASQEQRIAEIAAADRLERFDVTAPPLLRFALLRLEAERHRLLISNHHLLMDGWSAPILVRELLQAYDAGRPCRRSAERRRRTVSYLEWIAAAGPRGSRLRHCATACRGLRPACG